MTPVLVPPGCPGLPNRDASTVATPSRRTRFHAHFAEVQCRLTCTGLWTERRTCPRFVEALFRRFRDECVRLAHADDVPLLILPEDTCCRRCDRLHGNEPHTFESDRPRPTLLRQPAKAIGILWTRVPSTVAAGVRERIAPLRFPCRPPAHAAHTLPPWLGTKCFVGHCKRCCRDVPGSNFERAGHLLNPLDARLCGALCRAWD